MSCLVEPSRDIDNKNVLAWKVVIGDREVTHARLRFQKIVKKYHDDFLRESATQQTKKDIFTKILNEVRDNGGEFHKWRGNELCKADDTAIRKSLSDMFSKEKRKRKSNPDSSTSTGNTGGGKPKSRKRKLDGKPSVITPNIASSSQLQKRQAEPSKHSHLTMHNLLGQKLLECTPRAIDMQRQLVVSSPESSQLAGPHWKEVLRFQERISNAKIQRRQVVVSWGEWLPSEEGASNAPLVVFRQEASPSSFPCKNNTCTSDFTNDCIAGDVKHFEDGTHAGIALPVASMSPLSLLGDENSLPSFIDDEDQNMMKTPFDNVCNVGEAQLSPPAVSKEVLVPLLPDGLKAGLCHLKCTNCKVLHPADPLDMPTTCSRLNCQSSGELALFCVEIKCDTCELTFLSNADNLPKCCLHCQKRKEGFSGSGGGDDNGSGDSDTKGADFAPPPPPPPNDSPDEAPGPDGSGGSGPLVGGTDGSEASRSLRALNLSETPRDVCASKSVADTSNATISGGNHSALFETPAPTDITCGRGNLHNHEGNKTYQRIVDNHKVAYRRAANNMTEKQAVIDSVYSQIYEEEGMRFIERDPTTRMWKPAMRTKLFVKNKIRQKLCDSSNPAKRRPPPPPPPHDSPDEAPGPDGSGGSGP